MFYLCVFFLLFCPLIIDRSSHFYVATCRVGSRSPGYHRADTDRRSDVSAFSTFLISFPNCACSCSFSRLLNFFFTRNFICFGFAFAYDDAWAIPLRSCIVSELKANRIIISHLSTVLVRTYDFVPAQAFSLQASSEARISRHR